jgi:tetrathionate reductase subunit B
MYYIASTAPDGWAVQPVDPLSFDFLAGVVAPVVKWAVGLSSLGVLAMLGRQLVTGAGTPKDSEKPGEGNKEDGHA